MYPTLFHIFGFRIDTYSVIWFTALSLAIIWVLKRLKIYDIDENEARNVMSVSFLFMLLGECPNISKTGKFIPLIRF